MKKKAIAFGACVVVAGATVMPVALNATEANVPVNVLAKQTRDVAQGDPLDVNITLKAKGAEEVISGLAVTVECEGQEPVTVTSGEDGILNVNLPKYGVYKLTSEAPEGYSAGVGTTLTYSADNTPETNIVLELAKSGDEAKKELRDVVVKHVDGATKEALKGGKGQILDLKTKDVVVKDVDLKDGEASVGELEVGGSYVFEWLEEVDGYVPNVETREFMVTAGEGSQVVTLESIVEDEEKAEEINVVFELKDFVSKEAVTTGKAVVKQTNGDKTFELDFSKEETLKQTLMSGDEYEFEITEVPEGYIVPTDQFTNFEVGDRDGNGGMTQTLYVMKESDAGSLGGTADAPTDTLPQTGAVATGAGAGIAGLSAIGAFLVKRFRR